MSGHSVVRLACPLYPRKRTFWFEGETCRAFPVLARRGDLTFATRTQTSLKATKCTLMCGAHHIDAGRPRVTCQLSRAMDSPLAKEALMRVLLGIFAVFFLAAVTWASIPVAKQHGTVSIDPTGLTATKTNLPAEQYDAF